MLSNILAAMLPLIVVFSLGYRAGWHKDFDGEQVSTLNRMVMLYAFPLNLFVGITRTPRAILAQQVPLAACVFLLMCGSFVVAYLMSRHVFRRDASGATLQGLAIGAPSVPFIGSAMLPPLIGHSSATVAISAAVFAMVLVQTPLCFMLLAKNASAGIAAPPGIRRQIISSLEEPIVWAPIAATMLVVMDMHLPGALLDSLGLLGNAAAGVALFASGIVLFAQRVSITLPVVMTVAARNILVPAVSWGIMVLIGMSHETIRAAVLALSIPVGTVMVILAVRFRVDEREAASTLFLSAVLSVLTMTFFIACTE
ncbi:AEC family transporter [Gluconacetobacter entanii]|uniref:AEC family transporter n=1 Tax=Gluconacetobacter entanii TaxID=108528 RepID=UPI001C933246|nr:AEC family transporter [Gluconacetobacter entanii]MCE2577790.1 AEC family transporter [Komagataeibacter sp. FNDCR1]MBY4638848.1 AEC family transporter [Gluconacetobacter entanii]MCW4580845.1 AEC family transporter [Gluconacetobacter entanii]MCW4584174.1 AEC family transporter [Gluconacetobacter entanii]MCW4587518.1 AEC family transporter [Gluconacetobacter entanii]